MGIWALIIAGDAREPSSGFETTTPLGTGIPFSAKISLDSYSNSRTLTPFVEINFVDNI